HALTTKPMPAPNPRIHRASNGARIRFGSSCIHVVRAPEGSDLYRFTFLRLLKPDESEERVLESGGRVLRGKVRVQHFTLTEEAVQRFMELLVHIHREPVQHTAAPEADRP